jgi:hypothetical protein
MTTTTYQQVLANAEAAAARKREQHTEFVSSRTFRQNDKFTSQFSDDDHQTEVDDYGGKVLSSLRTRTTEHNAIEAAGGDPDIYENPKPLIETPNIFKTRIDRKCCSNCKSWKPAAEFSPQKRKNGNEFLQSWCKECRSEYAREQYNGLNKRIP